MLKKCLVGFAFLLCSLAVRAAVFHVDCNRPDNTGDGLSWATAKRTIQAAVNAAASGDTIRVGPGTYGAGTTVTPSGTLMNRVVCTKNVTIESTDGAAAASYRSTSPRRWSMTALSATMPRTAPAEPSRARSTAA